MNKLGRLSTWRWLFGLIQCAVLIASLAPIPQAQSLPASAPPGAKVQYAPDRDYDLLHVALDLKVDYDKLAFHGVVVNTLAPLRDGLSAITLDCGKNLNVEACEIAGQKATFTHDGDKLNITGTQPLTRGKAVSVTVRYNAGAKNEGFQWIKPTVTEPQRVGFWTNGQPDHNHGWVPIWDYPNDFATTETSVTVPADWYVVGNGALKSNVLDANNRTRTFHWQMDQPHATYLLSLAAGPFDIKTTEWRGVTLMYVVTKGKGDKIDEAFGETPEILSFYSDLLGVKFPWPKYAQSAMYDFPGGVEYVSATTFGQGVFPDKRNGPPDSAVIAHEIAHQWFGDLVTYKNWGEVWLGEGFATFFGQLLYSEHKWGKNEYDRRLENQMQGYFRESRRYQRPLSTNLYENPGAMFDNHSYLKGSVILHTLRRKLGDQKFFQGMRHYLTKYGHTPVDSHDLCNALTEGTGINLEPFFDQWVFKPGHPVLDYTWTWDEAKKQVVLTVKQTQDTKAGTPIYDLDVTVGLISGSRVTREQAKINKAEQEIRIGAADKPAAVLFDADHDFLREVSTLHWTAAELTSILKYAPNAVDRQEAMKRMLEGTPSDAAVQAVAEVLRQDLSRSPVFTSMGKLGELKRTDLRALFREQIAHPNLGRRAEAIRALGRLPKEDTDIQSLRRMVNDQEPYIVVRAVVSTLGNWDPSSNRDVFEKAAQMVSPSDSVRAVAVDALEKADAAENRERADPNPQTTLMLKDFLSVVANGQADSPLLLPRQRSFVTPKGNATVTGWLKDLKSFTPLACDEVQERGIVQNNERISRICFYRMVTGQDFILFKFSLTAEGKVAWYANYPRDF